MMLNLVGNAANFGGVLGVNAAGVITMIRQAAQTAQQNKEDCKLLAQQVGKLGELLPRLMGDPEATRALDGLDATLLEAHHLVLSCQAKGRISRLFTASAMADRFRLVEKKINNHLVLIPAVSYVAIARRLDDQATTSRSSSSCSSLSSSLLELEDDHHHHHRFTLMEIAAATNNFAAAHVLSDDAGSGTKVYKGKLRPNGPEVAVKRLDRTRHRGAEDAFFMEGHILARLRHDHIVTLMGTCADDGERMLVTHYMPNGTLHDHLHGHLSSSSPVTASWKTRVRVLLGAARAVEHLHRHASPLVVHCNVASSNILLDAAWAPRLAGFGAAVWKAAGLDSQPVDDLAAASTAGYADPEYRATGRVRPATNVYGLGVVMLEVLTGHPPMVSVWDDAKQGVVTVSLPSFALPHIEAGRLGDVLDRRPQPTTSQLQPLQLVASTAARCLSLHGDNRPAITQVVANLEQAIRLLIM